VEHKVNAGPFARAFPASNFWVTDCQYAFPLDLPGAFLGLPPWTRPLPRSSDGMDLWGGELDHEVLTVKPGPGSMYQDVALHHRPSGTVLVCDALFAVTEEPPRILMEEEEYTRALLFHARDAMTRSSRTRPTTGARVGGASSSSSTSSSLARGGVTWDSARSPRR